MSENRLHTATRIVRNFIVLFVLAAMAKGSGLIIAVIAFSARRRSAYTPWLSP
jgi:hypothetical protein